MAELKDVLTAEEHGDIEEPYQKLYTEKDGKFELTGITGVKTSADVGRLQTSLTKERDDHKATKQKLSIWGELDHEDVVAKLDRLPDLEKAASGKLDDTAIEEIVAKRVEGTIRSQVAPLERQVKSLTAERDDALTKVTDFQGRERKRTISDAIGAALADGKVVDSARPDAIMLAQGHFEVTEEGSVVTRDGISGVTAGLDAQAWLNEIQPKREHWWPASAGGGATGSGGGGGAIGGKNPWSADHWNMTAQGAYLRQHGPEKAEKAAKAAGTTVGGGKPVKQKA